jgi:hypothetical protein
MPRMWLPFRGDNDTKENSKEYIPSSSHSSFLGRGILLFVVIPIIGIVI